MKKGGYILSGKNSLSSFLLDTTLLFSVHDVFSIVTLKLLSLIYLVYLVFCNWLTKILSIIVPIPLIVYTVTENICENRINELAHGPVTAESLYQSTEILIGFYETRRRSGASKNLQHMKV